MHIYEEAPLSSPENLTINASPIISSRFSKPGSTYNLELVNFQQLHSLTKTFLSKSLAMIKAARIIGQHFI